jgi:phosphoenolpyruvate synthase/pyruvate phosphate dikinase
VPVVHALEHFAASGAADRLRALRETAAFRADPRVRAAGLAEVRALVERHPVAPALLAAIEAELRARFGAAPTRLRSSSNTEDLVGFSGAGLYESLSVALGDPDRPIAGGLRRVWASLWLPRAYDEREQANIDHARTSMGVLVHPAFPDERANGVAISRDLTDPIDGSAYYINGA